MAANLIQSWMNMVNRLRKTKMGFPAGCDLHMNELMALGSINYAVHTSNSSISIAEIQDRLQVTKSAVSQILDALVEKGYAERRTDSSDRRRMCMTVTPKGEQILSRMRQYGDRISNEVVARMGEEKIEQMIALFNEFTDIFIEVQRELASGTQVEGTGTGAAPGCVSGDR